MTITIACITTVAHELSARAIERTMSNIRADRVLVVSDDHFYQTSDFVKVDSSFSYKNYSYFVLHKLADYITTDHVLIVQYDGMAVNKNYWNNDFVKVDYIGAPWLWRPFGQQVGNGGFSLRSRRLIEATASLPVNDSYNEDQYICDVLKPQLVESGIRFADVKLASQFSTEREAGYRPSFGFHGAFNVPFFLDDDEIKDFIDLMPNRDSSGQLELIAYCYYCEKVDLADHAINLARQEIDNFDQIFVDYLNSIPGRFNFLLDKLK